MDVKEGCFVAGNKILAIKKPHKKWDWKCGEYRGRTDGLPDCNRDAITSNKNIFFKMKF